MQRRRYARRSIGIFIAVLSLGVALTFGASGADAASPTITVKDIKVAEGDSGSTVATFVIGLSKKSSTPVVLHYRTVDGTALAPVDYTAVENDVSILPGGDAHIDVNVVGDTTVEPDESFLLVLHAYDPKIADQQASALITNDDRSPQKTHVPPGKTAPGATKKPKPVTGGPTTTKAPKPKPTPRPNAVHAQAVAATVRGTAFVTVQAAPEIEASSSKGERSGPPGGGLVLRGIGWNGCGRVALTFGRIALGSAPVSTDGVLNTRELSVPGDAPIGSTTVAGSCTASGETLRASSHFDVVFVAVHRTSFVTSLTHHSGPVHAKDIAQSLIPMLLLVVALGFVTELFNGTVEENYAEIRSWFRLGADRALSTSAARRGVSFTVLVLIGGVMCSLVSPEAGLNASTAILAVGMMIALVIVTVGFDIPKSIVMHRRFSERGQIAAMPATIVVAAGCVLASRALHFRPGLLFGLLAILTFRRELEDRLEGKLAAIACAGILAISAGAWLLLIPVTHATRSNSSLWLLTVEATLSAITVVGLETVTFVLLPLRFMVGAQVLRWSKTAWVALLVTATTLYVKALVQPGVGGLSHVSLGALPFVIVPTAVSIAFWAYFRFRPDRPDRFVAPSVVDCFVEVG